MSQGRVMTHKGLKTPKAAAIAGIAFLRFIAVVRDRLGALEDRFFATVFLGSGLLYLAMTFTSEAMAGGLIRILQRTPEIVRRLVLTRWPALRFTSP
jgi:hypothetical protein